MPTSVGRTLITLLIHSYKSTIPIADCLYLRTYVTSTQLATYITTYLFLLMKEYPIKQAINVTVITAATDARMVTARIEGSINYG